MAFTDAQKVDIRRYCGYPAKGGTPTQAFGYRYFQWYGTLEFRMDNLSTEEETVVTGTFLANLGTLETALMGTSDNLDTAKAAVWEHNPNENKDRTALYNDWRRRLCEFFGVPTGPYFGGNGGVRLIV